VVDIQQTLSCARRARNLQAISTSIAVFCTERLAYECLTTLTLSLTVFTQRNFVADFLQAKCDFTPKTAVLRFWATLGGLRGNVRWTS